MSAGVGVEASCASLPAPAVMHSLGSRRFQRIGASAGTLRCSLLPGDVAGFAVVSLWMLPAVVLREILLPAAFTDVFPRPAC